MVSVESWLKLLESQIGRGVYVWGGNGQALDRMTDPEAWIRRHETDETNASRSIALYRLRKAAGIEEVRAFDCSGLMHWALKSLHILERDVSSRTLYARCEAIREEALKAGDFVFHHDGERIVHVGAYAGNGTVIECRGRDDGVVRTKFRKGYWNRFGRLTGAFSDDVPSVPQVQVKGKNVRIRSSSSTKGKHIRTAHAGERFPLLGIADTGWYRIDLNGSVGYITNKPRYTEVIDRA